MAASTSFPSPVSVHGVQKVRNQRDYVEQLCQSKYVEENWQKYETAFFSLNLFQPQSYVLYHSFAHFGLSPTDYRLYKEPADGSKGGDCMVEANDQCSSYCTLNNERG